MKLGLIGAGNMATALARGMGEPVLVHDVDAARAEALASELGGEAVGSNAELAERSDVLVLCHKPGQLEEVAEQVGGRASVVASILAATPTGRIEAAYGQRAGVPLHPEHPGGGRPGRALLLARLTRPPRVPSASCSSSSGARARSSAWTSR